jgi:hypothetical protein
MEMMMPKLPPEMGQIYQACTEVVTLCQMRAACEPGEPVRDKLDERLLVQLDLLKEFLEGDQHA